MRLRVKVNPGSKTEGVRLLGENLYQVRTRAPAEGGRANRRVVELLAVAFGVAVDRVRIVSGSASPLKTIEIDDGGSATGPPYA